MCGCCVFGLGMCKVKSQRSMTGKKTGDQTGHDQTKTGSWSQSLHTNPW